MNSEQNKSSSVHINTIQTSNFDHQIISNNETLPNEQDFFFKHIRLQWILFANENDEINPLEFQSPHEVYKIQLYQFRDIY